MLGIGIDTGGTCTDAVIYDLDTKKILGAGKALTTKAKLEIGIANALDTLPQELVSQAKTLSLSTTLATNACVENRGARAKLLLIGFEVSMIQRLKDIYASYGFHDLSQFIVLEAKAENLFSDAFDPDWEDLRKKAPEYFADCDAVGIVQKHPNANGGRFELTARQILREEISHPITIAYDISKEIDIIKTCVGTLLNARLIPLITEFMEAVHHVMEQRGLQVPVSIVRSDGSLMSEEMAKTCPVETLLCGPAASVIGSSTLSREPDALIIDMGGTTTDIALVRNGKPVMTKKGIHIGQWTTMVNGLYVDTFGLGGDSAVRYNKDGLYLDTIRVIPLSILAAQYDYVLPQLQDLADRQEIHGSLLHEYYILLKDISEKQGYTEEEKRICRFLADGPKITMDVANFVGYDPHYLHLERLEQDGIIMKSGLTPTDMMILRGDYPGMDAKAALAALRSLALHVPQSVEEIPEMVYEMVVKRMYQNICRILLEQQYPKQKALFAKESLQVLLDCFYEQAAAAVDHPESSELMMARLPLTTDLALIGVGAPIHVFLPRVAKLLQTRADIPPYAGVANAVGAIASRLVTRVEVIVKALYRDGAIYAYSVFEEGKRYTFLEHDEAEQLGRQIAERALQKKMRLQGLPDTWPIRITSRKEYVGPGLLYQTIVEAKAEEDQVGGGD